MSGNPATSILLGIGAGIACVLLLSAIMTGTSVAVPLFILSPLPIAVATLGWGVVAGISAALTTGAVILGYSLYLGVEPLMALVALLLVAGPTVWVCYLTGLSRQSAAPAAVEWFPLGRILLHAAIVVAAGVTLTGILVGYDLDELTRETVDAMQAFLTASEGAPPAREQIEPAIRAQIALLPFTTATLALLMLVFNTWLGSRIVAASGRARRPQTPLWATTLPSWAAGVFVLALALSFAGGPIGHAAGTVAGAFGFAHSLIGLAVIHALTLGRPARFAILALTYTLFLLGVSLFVTLLIGLADSFLNFRARRSGPHGT